MITGRKVDDIFAQIFDDDQYAIITDCADLAQAAHERISEIFAKWEMSAPGIYVSQQSLGTHARLEASINRLKVYCAVVQGLNIALREMAGCTIASKAATLREYFP